MDRKINHGINVSLIIGFILVFLGVPFLLFGIVMLFIKAFRILFFLPVIFCLIGAAFLTAGIVLLVVEFKKRKQIDQMIQQNRYRWGEVVDVTQNLNVSINGLHPYVVIVRCQDNRGLLHTFRSRNVMRYVDRSIIGKQVRIYCKDDSFKLYYVDIDPVIPQVIAH